MDFRTRLRGSSGRNFQNNMEAQTGTEISEINPLLSRRGQENGGNSTSHHTITMPEQEPNPEWLASVAERIKQEPKKLSRSAGKSSCCIFRVPQSLLEINDKAYQPHIVSIGPYHYGEPHLQMVQEHKWRFLGKARARAEKNGVGFNEFIKAVAADEERIRECYAETIEFSSQEFVEMMMLDGCFIVELFCIVGEITETDVIYDPLFKGPWMLSLMRDLLMLENQVPFFVLQSLYKLSILSSASLTRLALDFFNYGIQGPDEVLKKFKNLNENHLLDLFRSALIPPPPDRSGIRYSFHQLIPSRSGLQFKFLQLIPSASKLRKAGIRFKPRNSPARKSFLDIKFSDNGFLEIPHLTVDDITTSFLLNCIAYEKCYSYCSNHITSYISFMNCLINTPMDAEFLSDRGVIENYFGTDKELQKFFFNVGRHLSFSMENSYLANVFKDVNKYYRKYYRNNWRDRWEGFKHTYFNSPWSFMSALAALLLLILTITQTFFAAYAYFRPPYQH